LTAWHDGLTADRPTESSRSRSVGNPHPTLPRNPHTARSLRGNSRSNETLTSPDRASAPTARADRWSDDVHFDAWRHLISWDLRFRRPTALPTLAITPEVWAEHNAPLASATTTANGTTQLTKTSSVTTLRPS